MHFCFVIEESSTQFASEEQELLTQERTVKARIVRSNAGSAVQDIEGKKVIFAVRSENEAKCQAIARAIVDIHNIWIVNVQ
jgi:DNA-directed RNA polymerase subunit E'/Rpb7